MGPTRILDFGCGTGALLTLPLAAAFPEYSFVGVDADAQTLQEANREIRRPNISFVQRIPANETFGIVIASEVLEHLDDPAHLIEELRHRLDENGRLIITVPNGLGPFEAASFSLALLRALRLYPILHWLVRMIRRLRHRAPTAEHGHPTPVAMTLADSPHVHFYTLGQVRRLLVRAGFREEKFANRTIICGFVWDRIVDGLGLTIWNAQFADRVPPWLVSDWMMVWRKAPPDTSQPPFRSGFRTRVQRRLARVSV